jgi:hypothetical protein
MIELQLATTAFSCTYILFLILFLTRVLIIVKARCSTNTSKRGKVKYHQRTGSQSYIVQANLVVSR